MKIILASKSPRRREILSTLGISFSIVVSDADENCNITSPAELVSVLAEKKGISVAESLSKNEINDDILIISGDTVVFCDGIILGKPKDIADAQKMIKLLSGKTHSVFSGLSLITLSKEGKLKAYTDFEETLVTFSEMSEKEIDLYLTMENVTDKAGAYAIQGAASLWIEKIDGNYFNVVGLPVNKLYSLMKKADISIEDLTEKI